MTIACPFCRKAMTRSADGWRCYGAGTTPGCGHWLPDRPLVPAPSAPLVLAALQPLRALAILCAVLVMLSPLGWVACSGTQRPTPSQSIRIGINTAAHALAVTDRFADSMFRQSDGGGAHFQEYAALARGEVTAYHALLAAEHALDAYDASQRPEDKCRAGDAVQFALHALGDVVAALAAAGLQVPPELSAALPMLQQLAPVFVLECPILDGGF